MEPQSSSHSAKTSHRKADEAKTPRREDRGKKKPDTFSSDEVSEKLRKFRFQILDAVRASDGTAVERLLVEARQFITDFSHHPSYHVRFLLNQNHFLDRSAPSCLGIAIRGGNERIVRLLVDLAATLPKADSFSWDDLASVLLKCGMEDILTFVMGKATQKYKDEKLLKSARVGKLKSVDFYLKHGAAIDWQDKNEETALFIAVTTKNVALGKVLLSAGARLDLTKRDGRTVYEVALRIHNDEMARLILARFAKDNELSNISNIDLDITLRENNVPGALDLLQRGHSVPLRLMTSKCTREEEQVVGQRSEYLMFLCANIITMEQNLKKDRVQILQDTGSDEHFLCAFKWLLECLTKHVNCIGVEGPLPSLPTRVIDVGPADGSQNLVLLEAKGRKGRYVALSHLWGKSDIMKTTRENLQTRLVGMELCDLTKIMQDAVMITRRLGIRYLWIDAVCIIQDSHSDWSYEASNMANVYKNSLFTIAAAAAADHSQGCFASTESDGPGGKLSSRGWILQEELLSPRTLQYGFGVLKWDCITCTASSDDSGESQAGGFAVPTEQARFKRTLWGFRSTSMSLENQMHASWQQMMRPYSRRILTKDSDKLMAIMGIANICGKTLGDEFLSGLWKNHLYHDLLWTSESATIKRITSTALPTWSWASMRGYVSYQRWPSGSAPNYLKSVIEVVSAELDEGANGPMCHKLVLKGTLQKVSRGTSELRHLLYRITDNNMVAGELQEGSNQEEEEYKRRAETKEVNTASALWWPDIQTEKVDSAWVFAVAEEHYWIHCLVLVPVDDVDADVMVEGKKGERLRRRFRRVGRCHVDRDSSREFFRGEQRSISFLKEPTTFELV